MAKQRKLNFQILLEKLQMERKNLEERLERVEKNQREIKQLLNQIWVGN